MAARIRQVLVGFPEISVAFLFGSFARGRPTQESDVDVSVAGKHALNPEELIAITAAISSALGREADVVDLRAANGTILGQAMCGAEPIMILDRELYASLLRKLWYDEADMQPLYQRILKQRRERFVHG